MSFYTGDLAVLNGAHAAQQQADLADQQANMMYLLGLAKNRTDQSGVDSRERTANRGYQSEDLRTNVGAETARRDQDVRKLLGLGEIDARNYGTDASVWNSNNQVDSNEYAALQNRLQAQRIAELEAENKLKTTGLTTASAERIAALNPGRDAGALRLGQEQADDLTYTNFANELNKGVDVPWWGKAEKFKAQKDRMVATINAQGLGHRMAVVDGADGRPVAVVKPRSAVPLLGPPAPDPNPVPVNPPVVNGVPTNLNLSMLGAPTGVNYGSGTGLVSQIPGQQILSLFPKAPTAAPTNSVRAPRYKMDNGNYMMVNKKTGEVMTAPDLPTLQHYVSQLGFSAVTE